MTDNKKYKGPAEEAAVDHLKPGTMLPKLSLHGTDGSDVRLADVKGVSVVFIYPWTGRPNCPNPPDWDEIPGAHGSTPEIEGFRDLVGEFAALDIAIFGLSNQKTDYQREMIERLNVPFPILSDADGAFADALGLPSFETGGMKFLKRLSIVACDGRIEMVFYPIEAPETHARVVLESFRQGRRERAVAGAQRASSSASSTE